MSNQTIANVKARAVASITAVKNIEWSNVKRNTMLMAWNITGLLAFVVPFVVWTVHKQQYYKAAGYMVEYEQQQQEYEDQYNGDDNYNGNDDGNGYSNIYQDCGWYNFVCKRQQMEYANYYMASGDSGEQEYDEYGNAVEEFSTPSWFLFLQGGNTEEMRKWTEENTGQRMEDDEELGNTAGEVAALVYMNLAFLAVLGYGFYTFYNKYDLSKLKWSLFFLVQLVVVNFLLLPKLISSEDRMWDDSIYGWYGQTGVLMAYFDFWVGIFALVFLIVLAREDKKNAAAGDEQENDYALS